MSVHTNNKQARDLIGYGGQPPKVRWQKNAYVAVQFVLNYEEGAENSVLYGDEGSEVFLSEIIGATSFIGARHMNMESIYEYGSRAGVWRILQLFKKHKMPLTMFAVAKAAQQHPAVIERAMADGHEIASHGLRWINYHGIDRAKEQQHLAEATDILSQVMGERPVGWYTGRTSENSLPLLYQFNRAHGSFLYDSDNYSDDLPFWSNQVMGQHLIIPYTLDSNDMRFATAQGFNTADMFFQYLKNAFDILYQEGKGGSPKMLSIGLHCRLIGRPARFYGLQKFVEYIAKKPHVWVARRDDIARHWHRFHPYRGQYVNESFSVGKNKKILDDMYPKGAWVIEQAVKKIKDTATPLALAAVCEKMIAGAPPEKQRRLMADAVANPVNPTATFFEWGKKYKDKFGFDFITADSYLHQEEVLRQLQYRYKNNKKEEWRMALEQLHLTALRRLDGQWQNIVS